MGPSANHLEPTKMNAPSNTTASSSSKNAKYFDASRFTTEEKLSLCGGVDLWNLRAVPAVPPAATSSNGKISISLSDGPHGVRKPLNALTLQEAHPATCFPSACATACSWNVDLMERMGQALANECEYYDVQVLLGPGINLKRNPLGGRNHEYFSEDPLLSGLLGKAYIAGVQESGSVAACIKHFCANNQESARMVVNAVVDERSLRELYLPAFEMSICCRDGDDGHRNVPKVVMAAYNKVNGVYCCEHKYLLQSILRKEWKFSGVVVSDWGAVNDRVESLQAGMDLEMPGASKGAFDQEVLESIRKDPEELGRDTEIAIDHSSSRIADLIGELDRSKGHAEKIGHRCGKSDSQRLFDDHNQLARTIAQECIVMLQNRDNLLPLPKKNNVAVIGDFAKNSPRYQGMGSAHVTSTKVTSVYSAMESFLFDNNEDDIENQRAKVDDDGTIFFAQGYDADAEGDEIQLNLIDEAVEIALKPSVDVVVLFVGLPEIMESEGFDRGHMRLPQQHVALAEALIRVRQNVVIVLSNGGIVEIPQSFVDGAKSILDGFLLGQAGGHALVDVLFGIVSPSGKLAETIPLRAEEDVPSSSYFPGTKDTVEYREGLDVGYRYFDTANIPVRFPFGHGLQYSNFRYSNLLVNIQQDNANFKQVVVSVDVENIGCANKGAYSSFSKPVMEVVQLYIRPIDSSVYRPHHELKSFSKVELLLGEKKSAQFVLDERSFSYYDIGMRDWVVEQSILFELEVGASSRDIRLKETIRFQTGGHPSQLAKNSYPPVIPEEQAPATGIVSGPKSYVVDDETFTKRFGIGGVTHDSHTPISLTHACDLTQQRQQRKKIVSRNTLLADAATVSWIATILMQISLKIGVSEVKDGPTKKRELCLIRTNVGNVCLRTLVLFSNGNLSFKLLDFLILIMNGHYWEAASSFFPRKQNDDI
uniref:beta-glucosidase n=2 Tax=Pseudo-nitzschia australis TaxID=44445 RepID=A0A6U9W8D9_9STRA